MNNKIEEITNLMTDQSKIDAIKSETKIINDSFNEKLKEANNFSIITERFNTSIASVDNIIPTFENGNLPNLSNESKEVLNKFSMSSNPELINFYTELLNGKWSNPLTTNVSIAAKNNFELFKTLKSLSTKESFEEIKKYITLKSKESSCI